MSITKYPVNGMTNFYTYLKGPFDHVSQRNFFACIQKLHCFSYKEIAKFVKYCGLVGRVILVFISMYFLEENRYKIYHVILSVY